MKRPFVILYFILFYIEDFFYYHSRDFSICNENQTYVKEIWELILPSFSAYFINKSYNKLEQNKIIETKIEINDINANEVVRLYPLGNTNSSIVELIYHIQKRIQM